jgi:crotonobetainyl-CoA:carnitine CoA-transferase CaiB-like acyl-CoA transferase
MEATKSLEGIRVLDLSRFAAGPHCTMLLADLGAEVVKVEEPGSGEGQRKIPPFARGQAYLFLLLNRNKKGITLNLKTEEGREILKELATQVDVLVENFAPGVMARLGLGYPELRQRNPRLIYASISGFGQQGPYSSRPGYDMLAQAMGGMMSVTGHPEGPPTRTGPAVADFMGSLYLTIAILAALQARQKTGRGQRIDISLHDCVWATVCYEFAPAYFLQGTILPRQGNRHPNCTPYNTYKTKDGYVVIATATDAQWQSLLRAMGRENLLSEPRFATMAKRQENFAAVDALVEEWTRGRSVGEVIAELTQARVPCAPILTLDKVVTDPHLQAREMIQEMEHPVAGRIKLPGSVLKLSETPATLRSPAPSLGEHNREIYCGWLGLSSEKLNQLKEEGII